MQIEEIKEELYDLSSKVHTAEISVKILEYLLSKNKNDLQFITYQSLQLGLDLEVVNADLVSAVSHLTNHNPPVFKPHIMFVTEEEEEYEISLEEYQSALKNGVLVHPESGEECIDFKSKLFPFFTLNETLLEENN